MRKWVFTATNIKFQQELDGTLAVGWLYWIYLCAHVCWRVTGTEWGWRLGFELHYCQDEELATAQQEKYFCIKRDFTVKELLLH